MAEWIVQQSERIVQKSLLQHVNVIAAIDRGCTLTKIITSKEQDKDNYRLHSTVFHNENFAAALHFMRDAGWIVQDAAAHCALHVTGNGCDKLAHLIRDILNCKITFIDEMVTQTKGAHWLISNTDEHELCHPDEDLQIPAGNSIIASIFQLTWLPVQQLQQLQQLAFPCLAVFCGSACTAIKLHSDGHSELLGVNPLSGKSLMGLAHLLLDVADYNELMQLASDGDLCNVDSVAGDVLSMEPDSSYSAGKVPADRCIFPFGKGVDDCLTFSHTSRADLAASLVNAFAKNLAASASSLARAGHMPNVFIAGCFFAHKLPRIIVLRHIHMFCGNTLKVNFMRDGCAGAIGAMLSQPEDIETSERFMSTL